MKNLNKSGKLNSVIGVISNLFIPGLGTIIFGKYEIGMIQLSLLIACVLMLFSSIPPAIISLIVFPTAAVWIWAFATSICEIKPK